MIQDILGKTLLGNNIVQYVLFLGVVIIAFILAKAAYWLFSKTFLALTKKTKTRLDDLIVEALQGPIVFAIILAGLHYGKNILSFTESGLTSYNQFLSIMLTLVIAWFLIKISNAFLKNYIQPLTKKSESKFDDTIYPVIKNLLNFAIIIITIILILQNLGFQVTSLVAGLGIGGLAFALAAQDLLGNMFGGAAIVTDKPFKVGDRVKVDGQDGFVRKITLRTTTLETFGGTTVVMPNKRIADSTLENVTSEKMRRVVLNLGLTYDTPPKKIKQAQEIVRKIIKKHQDVSDNTLISFNEFGPSSLDIMVIYYIKDLDGILRVKNEINMEVLTEFNKAKLNFAFPTQTIHLEK